MANKRKCSTVDEKQGLELDPQVWQDLPQELLGRVITKLPFSRVVAFRTVSKGWYSDVIPRAASDGQASSRSALLYFDQPESQWYAHMKKFKESVQRPLWLQVCNSKSEWSGAVEEFHQKSFPSPQPGDGANVLICEQGLLFFGFRNRVDRKVREIVACNPLTAQSKSLGLPCPLLPSSCPSRWRSSNLLLGVVFDTKGGTYRLLVAGWDERGKYQTLLYNSSTCRWTNGPSILSTLQEHEEGKIDEVFNDSRSVSCNGNLYWITEDSRRNQYVLKYDFQNNTWRMTRHLVPECSGSKYQCQMAAFEGDVLLWHEHKNSLLDHLLNRNYGRYAHDRNWLCGYDLEAELAPEIKSMSVDMIAGMGRFLTACLKEDIGNANSCAFSKGNFIYHVLGPTQFHEKKDIALKIVVYDMKANSYVELPTIGCNRFSRFAWVTPSNVWSFSPSLTSVP